jgi:hypothetical protein
VTASSPREGESGTQDHHHDDDHDHGQDHIHGQGQDPGDGDADDPTES